MATDEQSDIEWLERDGREWAFFANQPDQLTARMTCTYLETGGIEARVSTQGGHYCVEVPASQLEVAYTVYAPIESGVLPAMQEETRKTGIHTGLHLREQLKLQGDAPPAPARGAQWGKWLLRLVVIAILAALLLFVFAS